MREAQAHALVMEFINSKHIDKKIVSDSFTDNGFAIKITPPDQSGIFVILFTASRDTLSITWTVPRQPDEYLSESRIDVTGLTISNPNPSNIIEKLETAYNILYDSIVLISKHINGATNFMKEDPDESIW